MIFRSYRIKAPQSDPFGDDTKSNAELIEALVAGGYLATSIEPKSKDASYTWLFEKDMWYLLFKDSYYVITSDDGLYTLDSRNS